MPLAATAGDGLAVCGKDPAVNLLVIAGVFEQFHHDRAPPQEVVGVGVVQKGGEGFDFGLDLANEVVGEELCGRVGVFVEGGAGDCGFGGEFGDGDVFGGFFGGEFGDCFDELAAHALETRVILWLAHGVSSLAPQITMAVSADDVTVLPRGGRN